ncbi:uncharacterized protein [Montipora foliosa]|uniref:uncharacterized protein n=1 Tax=Montipora foliosa TaxID=591990 RepID=UPI0035F20BCF
MKMFARTGDSGLPMPHPSICLYGLPLKLKTVFLVTLQSRRLKSNFELSCGSLFFMDKVEADVVRPFNPPFYDRYVDDCFSKNSKKKNEPDALFERLNRYHPNIVFTVEENPDLFLDTAFSYTNKFNCSVFKKPGKLPTHWKSEVPTKWKRNCITSALHRAKRISTDFDKDLKTLETSFINAGYPKRFISHTINNFLNHSPQDDNIIPNFLFEERKKVFIKLPFCSKNENLSKTFIEKLNKFTNFNFIFIILWQTRQIKTLFNNKDKNTHRSKVVYKGDCSCGVHYIGETVRNLAVRIAEHSNPAHTSEPAKHLRENPSHAFTWRVLSSAQTFHKRRIVEGLMIQQFRPSLNKQVISYVSKLFPLGIT